jgi:hypothetical protein
MKMIGTVISKWIFLSGSKFRSNQSEIIEMVDEDEEEEEGNLFDSIERLWLGLVIESA